MDDLALLHTRVKRKRKFAASKLFGFLQVLAPMACSVIGKLVNWGIVHRRLNPRAVKEARNRITIGM